MTFRLRPLAGGLALLAAAGLAGCASDTPRPTLITLPAVAVAPVAASAPAAAASAPVLVVRRVAIPEYLASRRVRFRADASTLAEWPNTYWAERIEVGVSREFTAAMRQALPGWTVCEGTCADRTAGYSLQVELQPFDYRRASGPAVPATPGLLQARAHAILATTEAPPRVLHSLELPLDRPVAADTPQAHAQAMSEALQALAQRLAGAVTAATR